MRCKMFVGPIICEKLAKWLDAPKSNGYTVAFNHYSDDPFFDLLIGTETLYWNYNGTPLRLQYEIDVFLDSSQYKIFAA